MTRVREKDFGDGSFGAEIKDSILSFEIRALLTSGRVIDKYTDQRL